MEEDDFEESKEPSISQSTINNTSTINTGQKSQDKQSDGKSKTASTT